MHEHDMDLIMALAEGTLGNAAAAKGESEISGCERCTANLELQRSALATLTSIPRVYLSAAESLKMRAGVRKELRLASPEVAPRRRTRRFPLGALAGAAAVLLAVVIAGPAFNLLGAGNDDSPPAFDGALSPAAPNLEEETVRAAAATEAPATAAPAPAFGQSEADAAPERAGLAATADIGEAVLPTLKSDTDLDRLRAIVVEGLGPDRLEDAGLLLQESAQDVAAAPPPEVPAPTAAPAPAGQDPPLTAGLSDTAFCDPESVDDYADGAVAILIATMEYEGTPSLVVAYVTGDVENTRIVVLSLETCEVVASA